MKANDIKRAIMLGNFTNDELNLISESVRYARASLVMHKKQELSVGSQIQFSSRGQVFHGTIESIKIKNALVSTSGGRYRVPLNMLNIAQVT
jgi:hypothetical protein